MSLTKLTLIDAGVAAATITPTSRWRRVARTGLFYVQSMNSPESAVASLAVKFWLDMVARRGFVIEVCLRWVCSPRRNRGTR